ncbi:insulinase family protein [Lactobacillus gasseri]|jgi:predicted Zn-dependent peptidase|uniref:Zinc protease n=1 Tax=Lactobacillus gasseri TaxID=1596 RepID=A0ABY3BG28_LACGS|nr:pitrilysin family protein [Lactobacillus gasseri]KXA27346.1 peptidase M16 inactive domain protein [Lactobacillus gasseri]MCT7704973.1 insulinase family protein [Lactobacillus gasseri]MCT7894564.1 insulinase family protein [Lactobacillus gasseri]MCZ3484567.1 insulinase family protein [Lactobacillus gasseri]MCZ3486362.1 insulinase family protein [Lactobacillus gasseri]
MKKLDVTTREYKSGFRAKVIRRPLFAQKFMGIIVDFGGSDPQKLCGGAHFLEHKLFTKKNGDISQRFEAVGASTNAFTTYNETMFYASFTEHWRQVLPLIFELVGTTHFTKSNVTKEAKIIAQELAMYQDDPNWQVNYELMQMMFPKTNLAEDLTGTKASLKKMTPEILQEIYDNNYISGRMEFVACGGFSENQTKEVLREVGKLESKYLISKKVAPKKLTWVSPQKQHNTIIESDLATSRVGIGIRLPDFEKVDLKNSTAQTIFEMMLQAKLGVTSPWFERMQKQGILNSPMELQVSYTTEGNFATIIGASNKPDLFLENIKSQLLEVPITKEAFVFQKKEALAQTIREFDDLSTVAIEEAEYGLENEDFNTAAYVIQSLSFSEFYTAIDNILAKSDIFTTILKGKEEAN